MACQSKYWTGKKDGRKKAGSKNSVPAWNKGIPQTEAVKEKLSIALKVIAKEKGFGLWMTGKKQSLETRIKKSNKAKERVKAGTHNFWKGGITPLHKNIRTSLPYKLWRESVFTRDNYTCQICGIRFLKGVTGRVMLNADHIKPFSQYPEFRFDINNGRTLCVPCHKLTPTYMGRIFKGKKLTKQP